MHPERGATKGEKLFLPSSYSDAGYTSRKQPSSTAISALFQDAFTYYQGLRNEKGIYRDKARFDGQNNSIPSSIAVNGIGLISLAIGDAMNWTETGKEDAILTLESVLGRTPEFQPDRNQTGFYRHFIDMNTGERAWESEYSTIDTAIMVSGALFAKSYFNDTTLTNLVNELWHSIEWESSIQDPVTGGIYRELNADGTGVSGAITLPFNEYMIVAWLAYLDSLSKESDNVLPAEMLWSNHYENPELLPMSSYNNIALLTDQPGKFLSHFIVQFNHFLCNYFTTSSTYQSFFDNARDADKEWWNSFSNAAEYEWGLGAGTSIPPYFYHADAIENNPGNIVSPHILAGFLGAASNQQEIAAIEENLSELLQQEKGVKQLSNGVNTYSLAWRHSLDDPNWSPDDIQGIDYASMLFGLASLPQHLGNQFFSTHNNFDIPLESERSVGLPGFEGIASGHSLLLLPAYPNPLNSTTTIPFSVPKHGHVEITIYDSEGNQVATLLDRGILAGQHAVTWNATGMASGIYYYSVTTSTTVQSRSLVLIK